MFCMEYANCTLKQIGDTEGFKHWLARGGVGGGGGGGGGGGRGSL